MHESELVIARFTHYLHVLATFDNYIGGIIDAMVTPELKVPFFVAWLTDSCRFKVIVLLDVQLIV